jgi:xanthine dehydrogenase accessory factor
MPAKELLAILNAYSLAQRRGEPSALVTVVKTSGSTYRRPGARMFVDAAGRTVGSISGGCLEEDARERALEAIALSRSATFRYDTTAEGDIVWGSGLGCNGVVHVLIEPLPGGISDPALSFHDSNSLPACLARTLERRRNGALASIFLLEDASGSPAAVGEFAWVSDDSLSPLPVTNIGDPALAAEILTDARAVLRSGKSRACVYNLPKGGRAEAFIDAIAPPRSLLIFGAGHDAPPLSRLAKEIGWRVEVIDGRRAHASPARFPEADAVTHCAPRAIGERITIEPGAAAVVMTHNYLNDLDILRALLDSPAGYIGLLGPQQRKERLLADLAKETAAARASSPAPELKPASLRRVHGPAGLDIGAETPDQIALSILAEIEAFSAGRRGGPLKNRRGPLHETAPEPLRRKSSRPRTDALAVARQG